MSASASTDALPACFPHASSNGTIAGEWKLRPATAFIRRFFTCPLLDSKFVGRMRDGRRNATGLQLPRFFPTSCSLPRFSARALLSLLAGRTLVIVGDSVSEQHFHSLACSLLVAEAAPGMPTMTPSWWPTNATRSELWRTRSCLPFGAEPSRLFLLCLLTAAKANEMHAPPDWLAASKLRAALQPTDVVLLNAGVHFSEASTAAAHFEQLVGPLLQAEPSGRAKPLKAADRSESNGRRESSGKKESSTSKREYSAPPLVVYAQTAPQHFAGGRYPSDDPAAGCVPHAPGCASCNLYNARVDALARAASVPILPLWHASAVMHGEHAAPPRDCTHFLLPGVPSHWSELLLGLLATPHTLKPFPAPPAAASSPPQLSPQRRWHALRRAFTSLPGCIYHHRGTRARGGRSSSASAENASCCTAACRAEQLMAHGPPT